MHKKKGKNIKNSLEEKQETLVQKRKGKYTKGALERKDEVSVKDFEKPVVSVGSHSWIAAGAEPDTHQFNVTICL